MGHPAADVPSLRASRRRLAIVAGIGLILAGGGATAWLVHHHPVPPPSTEPPSPPAPCTGTGPTLAGVWDPAIQRKVHAAFIATNKPYAEPASASVIKALDAYFAEWTTATVENCNATPLRGGHSAQAEAIRQLCLDQRFEEARTLAEMLQDPTAALVSQADTAVWALDPVAACAHAAAIVLPAIEPRYRADYRRLLLETAAAHAQAVGGQLVAAEGALMHAADEGRRIHADDLVALALHGRAAVLFGQARFDQAYRIAGEAVWTALLAHRDDLVIGAALTVASARAEAAGHLDVADAWVDLANAAAARTGGFAPMFDERRLELIGVIAAQRGDLRTAVASHTQALAAAQRLWGRDNPEVWSAEVQLATTLASAGAWVEALPHYEHALQLREASVGPDHPDVALILSNLAGCYDHAGDTAKALAAVKRALQIREKTYGPKSPLLVATLDNLADFELRHHELAPALADI
ncbi:MAG: tetratricopeptide repeat protein, partial [Kofleriaceae bacterium]